MQNKNKDFCIFILSHGRADNVHTFRTLKRMGCTYPIFFIVDNEDKTVDKYYKNFGKENVIVFDKLAISKTFDTGDNFDNRKTIVYARNACFDIAEKLGYKYFLQLDDDYTAFEFRFDSQYKYVTDKIRKINNIFPAMLEYFKSMSADSIAFAQGGDFIGGSESSSAKMRMKRKCMNTFFCSTDKKFKFVGRINEDVNTYTSHASKGSLFLTVPNINIVQHQTQSNKGGMSEVYLDNGTYLKSFYSVMYSPNCVSISLMGNKEQRLHHRVSWNNAVPKILSERHKKYEN